MCLWFSLSPADELSLDECRIALPPISTCWTFIHRRSFAYERHGYCINETLPPLLPWEQKWRWCHAALFTSQISWEGAAGCVELVIMSEGIVPSLCTDWMPTQSPSQPYSIMVENGTFNRFIHACHIESFCLGCVDLPFSDGFTSVLDEFPYSCKRLKCCWSLQLNANERQGEMHNAISVIGWY